MEFHSEKIIIKNLANVVLDNITTHRLQIASKMGENYKVAKNDICTAR